MIPRPDRPRQHLTAPRQTGPAPRPIARGGAPRRAVSTASWQPSRIVAEQRGCRNCMIFFSLGLPSRLARWCDELVLRLLEYHSGPTEAVALNGLEDLAVALIRTKA